jgi:dipeptidyl aminopeptidase/acylaminoacyl peptidase
MSARTILLFALACAAAGCARDARAPDPAPLAAKAARTYTPEQFYATVSYGGASFSADETRILTSSDTSGVFNVYAQPVAGGPPEQLTHSTTDSTFAVSWFPQDDRFLYTADQGGNELDHLYVMAQDGTATDLTPGANLKAEFMGWSGDRRSFYVETNERDPKAFDVYRYATSDYARERIFENDGRFYPAAVSRDGRLLALIEAISNTRTDVWIRDLASGAMTRATPEADVAHRFLTFTPDSRALYYTTHASGEFDEAWSYDIANGERSPQIRAEWDVLYVGFSERGRYRVSALNADADTVVDLVDTTTGESVAIPGIPKGDLRGVAIARSESQLAFYLTSDTSPANLYTHRIGEGSAHRLTSSLSPEIDEADLVESTVVRFPSFDGLQIPAVLWQPKAAEAKAKAPALVFVHGGPGGQTRRGWSADVQALVNHGYAVLGINNRGSSGYGKTFFHLDDRRHGAVDLDDCVFGKRYLASLDWVDADRIGIMGGSYGGYMVAAALAFRPQEFAVGVDIFGVTNWVRTLESVPPWWGAQRAALYDELGDPAIDRERLTRISPLFHAQNIVRPLLVVQGKNDPRVLQAESDELVAAARANGVPVEYVVFDDEGHGFTKKKNRIVALSRYLDFLGRYLKAGVGA